MAARENGKTTARLIYLYGITREQPARLRVLDAVDGESKVEAQPAEGFIAWISRVDAAEFGERLQQNMENLDWLAQTSVRHQKVVDAIHKQIEILPARFATLFRTEDSLAQHVREQKKALAKSFQSVAGADEYAVKVFAVPQAAAVRAATSGADYLKRKSQALQAKTSRNITPELEQFIALLHKISKESADGGRVGSGQRNLVWHRALLVARDRRAELEKALEKFGKNGEYRVECTGPWPPYSFLQKAE